MPAQTPTAKRMSSKQTSVEHFNPPIEELRKTENQVENNAEKRSSVVNFEWPVEPGNYWTTVATSIDELEQHLDAWEQLGRAAVEPNPFYERWMLLPALRAFGGDTDFRFVMIYYRDHRPQEPPRMCGFFPLFVEQRAGLIKPSIFTAWGYEYCFLKTPLIRRDLVRETWGELWNWLLADAAAPNILKLEKVHGEGKLYQGMVELFYEQQVSTFVHETFTRALLQPKLTVTGNLEKSMDEYIQASMSNQQRRELRRKHRRMEELGNYEFREFTEGDDLNLWTQQFLDLEASGWKGETQSAIKCSRDDQLFVETIVRSAEERGQLELHGFFLDDVPVAMKLNFLTGEGGYGFKICYDEQYFKFSPGVQLELETMRTLHDERPGHWMDSCARPDHPMANRLWSERRTIQSVSLCGASRRGEFYTSWLSLKRAVKRMIRKPRPAAE